MPAAASAAETPAPVEAALRGLRGLVNATRRRLRWSWVGAGTGLAAGLFVAALLLAAILDIALGLPDFARWLAFAALATGAALLLFQRVLRPLFRRLTATGTALRIERTVPNMHNRLVTALDLGGQDRPPESEPFFRLIVRQAQDRLADFRIARVIDGASLRRAALWAALPAAALAAGWFAAPRFVPPAVLRVLMPWADIPPPSWLTLVIAPGSQSVLRGDAAELAIAVEGGAPESVGLQAANAAGERRTVAVPRGADGRYVHRFDQVAESVRLRAFGGRTWSRDAQLTVVPRPELRAVATRILPPEYLSDLPPRDLRPDEREFSALAGSRVEVVAETSSETAAAFLPRAEEKYAVDWRLDLRTMRWWLTDEFPPGFAPYGPWQFDWSRKHRRSHAHPPTDGEGRYGAGFNPPAAVRADDVFVTSVCVDPLHAPQQIMLEFNDGQTWNQRAWWGEDKLKKPAAATSVRLGAVPKPGEWTRLEIPAAAIGMAGKPCREFAFVVHGGRVRWDWFGACQGRPEPRPVPGRTRQSDLAAAATGAWKGGFPVDLPETYTVQLRDSAGHGNLAPETYRVKPLADLPPVVRIERPGKDILLAKAAPVELTVVCLDDTALAKAELVVVRQRETRSATKALAEWKKPATLETLRVALPLAELDPQPGDVFAYRVRATDRKGQTAESPEFKVTIQDSHDACDKQRERFEQRKGEIAKQARELLKRQQEQTEQAQAIAARHEPPPAEPPDPKPEAAAEKTADAKTPNEKTPDAANKEPTAKQPSDAAKPADASKRPDAKKPPADAAKQPQKHGEPSPLSPQERQQLGKIAEKEEQLRNEAKQLGDRTEELLRSQEAQTASDNERQSLQDARQELAKDAAPDLQQAAKEARQAAQRPDDARQTQDAKQAAERAEQDLRRLANELDRMEKIEKLAREDSEAAKAEKAALEQQAQQERQAKQAADELAELENRLGALKKEVGQEQEQQERLAMQAEQAANDQQLKQAENQQQNLEGKATDTLRDVTDALGGQPPKHLQKSPEDAAAEPPPNAEGQPAQPEAQPGADAADAKAKEADAKTPGEGQQKAAEGDANGPPMGETKDAPQPGDVPQFETLKRQGPKTKADRNAAKKAQAGKSADDRKEELGERQDTLRKDLDLAANALERRSGELEAMMKALRGAASNPDAAKALMQSKELQRQLAAAERAGQADAKSLERQMQARSQPGIPGGQRPGKGTDGLGAKAAGGALTPDEVAQLKLQPREREELLQGSKAPTPDSYKPFVRDYYNRLSETPQK